MNIKVKVSYIVMPSLAVVALLAGGCDFFKTDQTRLLSPDKVIKAPEEERSPINPILPSIGLVDTAQEIVPNATLPKEGDWSYSEADYTLGPNDIVDISIMDLYQEGLETILRRQVTERGFVDDLPQLAEDEIKVDGLTKKDVKDLLVEAYSPDVLKDPSISVTVVAQRQNTFSILGAVARPNSYTLISKDMRLLEALALSGGVTQTNIRYIYVIRPAPAIREAEEEIPAPVEDRAKEAQLPPLPEIPAEEAIEKPIVVEELEPAEEPTPAEEEKTEESLEETLRIFGEALDGTEPEKQPETLPKPSVLPRLTETVGLASAPTTSVDSELKDTSKAYKWVYSNGRWIRVTQEAPVAKKPSGEGTAAVKPAMPKTQPTPLGEADENSDPFGWKKLDKAHLARIIAVRFDKLKAGDPRMNIVIRDNDIIRVPFLKRGEFYVTGEVLRPGVYDLTGRKVTVKMALAAAGNLGPLAWPENSILIRRIGDSQEQIVPLNIEAIFRGEEPDIYLKANDLVAVGTDVRSSFYAVIRNAFRMTYGFGFIYDRNFADPLDPIPVDSRRFTRW